MEQKFGGGTCRKYAIDVSDPPTLSYFLCCCVFDIISTSVDNRIAYIQIIAKQE